MKRPQLIHILGRDYSITYELDDGDYGSCDTMQCEIEVREGMPRVEEQDTVLHEVMHAVWALMDIGNRKVEEHVVRKMATGLLLVLQQNPDLTKYLVKPE
ncbi:hypothetical protein [Pseudoduganella lutea]|uniref:Phage protein n=1 Tax=Pseudoduganella lutea TaxID=321985 RepID=A0A4P6L799_9BURK|nr:hypothetical protein [Pseudoduganella lutea]QBE66848.1 hypothetical protein EWM63_30970 [Pseudoduganella lutea]